MNQPPVPAPQPVPDFSQPVQNFYQQIAANRRQSIFLVFILTALLAVFGFVDRLRTERLLAGRRRRPRHRHPDLARAVAASRISRATRSCYRVSGAREVNEQAAPQLMNVVQELAIAANIPMPKVYIINDTAPNAFATGRDPQHASVAITEGLLQKLDREELQGVIGHELSHVRNWTSVSSCSSRRSSARSRCLPTSSCASPSGAAFGRPTRTRAATARAAARWS